MFGSAIHNQYLTRHVKSHVAETKDGSMHADVLRTDCRPVVLLRSIGRSQPRSHFDKRFPKSPVCSRNPFLAVSGLFESLHLFFSITRSESIPRVCDVEHHRLIRVIRVMISDEFRNPLLGYIPRIRYLGREIAGNVVL